MRNLLLIASMLTVAPLAAAPVPKITDGSGVIYVWSDSQPPVLNLYTPDGEHIKELKLGTNQECQITSISPGGKYAAVMSDTRNAAFGIGSRRLHLLPLANVNEELPEPIVTDDFNNLCWTANGRTAIVTLDAGKGWFGEAKLNLTSAFEYDTTTGQKSPLDLEPGHEVLDVSADGHSLLTNVCMRYARTNKFDFAHIVRPRLGDTKPLYEEENIFVRNFHPDGKRVFASRMEKHNGVGFGSMNRRSENVILDPETGTVGPLDWAAALWAATGSRETKRWAISPDGKRVVLSWCERMWVSDGGRDKNWHWVDRLGVCDLNGQKFKVIFTATPRTSSDRRDAVLSSFAWR